MTETQPHIPEHKNRLYTLVGIGLAMFLGALDQTIVSTATPKIVDDLHGLDRITWITTVYLLLSTVMVPIYGKLADIMSRKTLTLMSVTVFLIGSALCGMAGEFGTLPILGDGMTQLIIFRAIQGLGGAGIFSLAFIIIADLYPPRERGKISGLFGAVFGLSSIVGPLLGGFLTDHASWRWVFYVNIPVGILALWFIVTKMPRLRPHDHSHKFNIPSAILTVLAFGPLTLGLSLDKNQNPWDSPQVLILMISGAVFLALWIIHSLKTSHPVIELRLFKNKVFSTTFIAGLFFGAGFFSVLIFMPMYMIYVQGTSATQAGISIIPVVIGIVLGASLGGIIAGKIGKYKGLMILGSAIAVVAALLLTFLRIDTPQIVVIVFMLVCGLSFGPGQSLYSLAVQNDVEPKFMGQATSATQFSRQMGSTIGSAVLGAIFTAVMATNAGSTAGTASFDRNMGLEEIRTKVEQDANSNFNLIAPKLEVMLSSNIIDAEKTYQDFVDSAEFKEYLSKLPDPSMADVLKQGGPSYFVLTLENSIISAINNGKTDEIKLLLAKNPANANDPKNLTLEKFPVEAVLKIAELPKDAALTQVDVLFKSYNVNAGPFTAKAGKDIFDRQKQAMPEIAKKQAASVVEIVRSNFAKSINYVWWIGFFIMVAFFISNFFIPNKQLRARGEHAGPPPAAH